MLEQEGLRISVQLAFLALGVRGGVRDMSVGGRGGGWARGCIFPSNLLVLVIL